MTPGSNFGSGRPPGSRRFRDTPLEPDGDQGLQATPGPAPLDPLGAAAPALTAGEQRDRPGALPSPAGEPSFERPEPSEQLNPPPDLARRFAPRPSVLSQPEIAWPAGLLAGGLPAGALQLVGLSALAPLGSALALLALELFWARRGARAAARGGVLGFGVGLLFVALDGGLNEAGLPTVFEAWGLVSTPAAAVGGHGVAPGLGLPEPQALGCLLAVLPLAGLARLRIAALSRLLLAALLLSLGVAAGRAGAPLTSEGSGDLRAAWIALGVPGVLAALGWIAASASGVSARSGAPRSTDAWWFVLGALSALGAAFWHWQAP